MFSTDVHNTKQTGHKRLNPFVATKAKRRILKKTFYILTLIFLLSCTKEPTNECFPGVRIRYRYVLNNQYENLFENNVESITTYIFDKDSLYYGRFSDMGQHLSNSYVKDIPLEVGKYTIISWGGAMESSYSVGEIIDQDKHTFRPVLDIGKTHISDFRIMLNNYQEGAEDDLYVVEKPTDLFYGKLDINVEPSSFAKVENIELIKNTNHIKVIIDGTENLPIQPKRRNDNGYVWAPEEDLPLHVYCVAKNGRYAYDNSIAEYARSLTYVPPIIEINNNRIVVEMTVMRLVLGDSPKLIVNEPSTNTNLVNENIIDQILTNPSYNTQTDLDREDTYVFEVKIERDLSVTVFINGWEIVDLDPEIRQ